MQKPIEPHVLLATLVWIAVLWLHLGLWTVVDVGDREPEPVAAAAP